MAGIAVKAFPSQTVPRIFAASGLKRVFFVGPAHTHVCSSCYTRAIFRSILAKWRALPQLNASLFLRMVQVTRLPNRTVGRRSPSRRTLPYGNAPAVICQCERSVDLAVDCFARSRALAPKSLCEVAEENRGACIRNMADMRVRFEQYGNADSPFWSLY